MVLCDGIGRRLYEVLNQMSYERLAWSKSTLSTRWMGQRAILLYHFDACVMARSEGKFAVAGKQRRVERFCQCDVQGIVGS
jgi:hypothetical protein